jgi:hypothetical protein
MWLGALGAPCGDAGAQQQDRRYGKIEVAYSARRQIVLCLLSVLNGKAQILFV